MGQCGIYGLASRLGGICCFRLFRRLTAFNIELSNLLRLYVFMKLPFIFCLPFGVYEFFLTCIGVLLVIRFSCFDIGVTFWAASVRVITSMRNTNQKARQRTLDLNIDCGVILLLYRPN